MSAVVLFWSSKYIIGLKNLSECIRTLRDNLSVDCDTHDVVCFFHKQINGCLGREMFIERPFYKLCWNFRKKIARLNSIGRSIIKYGFVDDDCWFHRLSPYFLSHVRKLLTSCWLFTFGKNALRVVFRYGVWLRARAVVTFRWKTTAMCCHIEPLTTNSLLYTNSPRNANNHNLNLMQLNMKLKTSLSISKYYFCDFVMIK